MVAVGPGDLWQFLGQAPPAEKEIGGERPSGATTAQEGAPFGW